MKFLMLLLALAAMAPFAAAQRVPEVPDGSYWASGGNVIRVDVTEDPQGGAWVTGVGAAGFSQPAHGTRGQTSTPAAPTAAGSRSFFVGADEYSVDEGVVKHKNSHGKWTKAKRVKPPKKKASGSTSTPGNVYGTAATPGEEVTTLPD